MPAAAFAAGAPGNGHRDAAGAAAMSPAAPLADRLRHAVGDGSATIVTPNNRLARRLAAAYAAAQRARGLRCWETPRIVPWSAWSGECWRVARVAGLAGAEASLLGPAQGAQLWRRIVAAGTAGVPLQDPDGAAALAGEAWRRMHAWGGGAESWRGWQAAGSGDDVAAFAGWCERYTGALRRLDAIDDALLPDRLASLSGGAALLPGPLVLAGYAEQTPQQQRLLAALRGAGTAVAAFDPLAADAGDVRVVACADPRDEIVAALEWARRQVDADPTRRVGVAIADLAARRGEVVELADDVLCPRLAWPDELAAPRPYNLSLGVALAEVPLVAAALDLAALTLGPLPAARVAALLRSRYLPGDRGAWVGRAGVEAAWLDLGLRQAGLDDCLRDLAPVDASLAARWRAARSAQTPPGRASPARWAGFWRDWLVALGWPGDPSLASGEHQALQAWNELLQSFAALEPVEPLLARRDAWAALAAMAAAAVFQPEAAAAPIEILGLLEAAGQPFDALWVTGMGAAGWPPAARPSPLLPLRWQRDHDLPHASAARELAYARRLTADLARAAPTVVLSFATRVDDHPNAPSVLVAGWPRQSRAAPVPRPVAVAFATRPAPEIVADKDGPALATPGAFRGGAGLVEQQSDCPFRAFAIQRLRARPWPRASYGLSAAERGNLVHAVLAAFWQRVGTRDALAALDDPGLAAAVAQAVDTAFGSGAVASPRWSRLAGLVEPAERARLAAALAGWLRDGELAREPFTVVAVERAMPLALGELQLALRIDRIDRLPGGTLAIIDYKTGRSVAPLRWFDPRPQGPQLPLYLLAHRAAVPAEAVAALAYAGVRAGNARWSGVAANAAAWPDLGSVEALTQGRIADWAAATDHWRAALAALAGEFVAGHAAVLPRSGACRTCGLQALCRVDAVAGADETDAADA